MSEQLRSAHAISSVFSISPREEMVLESGVFLLKRMACCGALDMVPFHVFLSDFQQLLNCPDPWLGTRETVLGNDFKGHENAATSAITLGNARTLSSPEIESGLDLADPYK